VLISVRFLCNDVCFKIFEAVLSYYGPVFTDLTGREGTAVAHYAPSERGSSRPMLVMRE
jgi:hypothetical protein